MRNVATRPRLSQEPGDLATEDPSTTDPTVDLTEGAPPAPGDDGADESADDPVDPTAPTPSSAHRWGDLAAATVVVGIGVYVALRGRDRIGHIGYTLDDPYIHLRVSEMIRAGHYGLEPGINSSPASSIIWPVLLAPFSGWSRHYEVPLLLNLLCVAGIVIVGCALLRRAWSDGVDGGAPWRAAAIPAAAILCVAGNIVGTALTGMEHTLQTLIVLTIGFGVVRAIRGEQYAWWCWAAIVVAPLVRYESALVSGAAIAVAWYLGDRRKAYVAAGATAAGLIVFGIFLTALGLDPLPSSILAKSSGGLSNISHHGGVVPYLAATSLAVTAWGAGRKDRVVVLTSGFVLFVYTGHMIGATSDEIRYATSVNVLALLMLASILPRLIPTGVVPRIASALCVAALLAVPGTRAWDGIRHSPDATQQIAEQQCELHRFTVDYLRQAVAANDIGCLAYRNPYPVLDLWGLASEEARKARKNGEPEWMDRLVRKSDVDVALIYPIWFGANMPPTWIHIGSFLTETPGYAAYPNVDVFATNPESVDEIRAALIAYRDAPTHPGTIVAVDGA